MLLKKRWFGVISVILAIFLTLTAGGGQKSGPGGGSQEEGKLTGTVVVAGSTAMQPVIEEAAKRFMEKNPGAQITVQGGGSGTGLSQVSQGACDIGMSDIFAEEKAGIDAGQLKDHKVLVQAFALVTHPEVGVDNLTKQQIQEIFTGKITNWKEVGGRNQKIFLVDRAKGSGTRATFHKYVMEGKEEIKGDVEQESSGTVYQIVSQTPGAVSYLAIAYLNGKVKPVKIDGAAPTEEDINTGKYPLWAFGHLYTKGEPSKVVKAFIDFVLSDEVQNGLIREMKYFPVKGMKVEL